MIRREVTRNGASSIETYYYKNTVVATAHNKNDLPSIILIRSGYRYIVWHNKQMVHRDNGLPNLIESDNSNIYYATEYGIYGMYYRYNGYSILRFGINKFDRSVKFNNGICIIWLKINLDNI